MTRNLGIIGVSVFTATFMIVLTVGYHMANAPGITLPQSFVNDVSQVEGTSIAIDVPTSFAEPEFLMSISVENTSGKSVKITDSVVVESGMSYRAITPSLLEAGTYNIKVHVAYKQNWLKYYNKSFVLSVLTVKKKEVSNDK